MSTTIETRSRKVTGPVTATIGVILLAFPLLTPIVGWLMGLPSGHANFDWLMPFELFPATVLGVVLILVASLMTKRRRVLVAGTIGGAVLATVLGMIWAVVSGIANEVDVANTDWRIMVGLGLFALAYLILLAVLVAGAVLATELARQRRTG